MDWLDYVPMIVAVGALLGVVMPKITKSKVDKHVVTEIVDATVLEQFKEVMTRMTSLEKELAVTRAELAETRKDLATAIAVMDELRKVEEFLQGALINKEKELIALRTRERQLQIKLDENSARLDQMMKQERQ